MLLLYCRNEHSISNTTVNANEYKNRGPTGGAQNIRAHGRGTKHKGPTGGAQDNEGPIREHNKSKRPEGANERACTIQYR